MASFVVFEDNRDRIGEIYEQLEVGGHVLSAPPQRTIQGAFQVLNGMLEGHIQADFLLVDGTLKDADTGGRHDNRPVFAYEHVGETETRLVPTGLFGRKTKEVILPKFSVFEVEPYTSRRHGKTIIDIARGTGIAPPARIIGFSGDGMRDLAVDFDIDTKDARKIHEAVEALTN